jgi:hypothetical protein
MLKCILRSNAGSDRSIGFRYTHSAFGGGTKEIEIWIRLLLIKKRHQYGGKLKLQHKHYSNLDVMLSMDSGNAHIAAIGVKVITLWEQHPYAGFYPLINQWKMRWFLIEINFHFGIWE